MESGCYRVAKGDIKSGSTLQIQLHMLRPLGSIYGKAVNLRNALYDRGVFKSYDLGAKTISVGNITTGGTGKTPLVARVAELLAQAGEEVCILTRGYGRKNAESRVLVSDGEKVLVEASFGGDEPVELARKLIGKAVVVADADRVAGAAWAKKKFGVTTFVLDDAFQHRRARRDLDIVCIDATDPWGSGRVLPAGRLREPLDNLARATAIVVTRANLVEDLDTIIASVRGKNSNAPIFVSRNRIVGATSLFEMGGQPEWTVLQSQSSDGGEVRVLAFCGLGNTKAFFMDLQGVFDQNSMDDEFDLITTRTFPDHHRYTQGDVAVLEQQARDCGVHALVTTAKDAVKLDRLKFTLPCFVVHSDLVLDNQEAFGKLVISS